MLARIRVLLVEDDPIQAEWIAEEIIWKNYPGADVIYFDSESSVLAALKEENGDLAKFAPTHALIDLLVRYYSPEDLADLGAVPTDDPGEATKAGERIINVVEKRHPKTHLAAITVMHIPEDPQRKYSLLKKGGEDFPKQVADFLQK